MRLSVCIPYKDRLENLSIALEALERQTMAPSDFEVVIGAMEYSHELIELGVSFNDRLDIVIVSSSRDFSIPVARNLAMRAASGDVVVQMDADTMLDPHALEYMYERHFAFGQEVCAVGQVVGYGNNQDGAVEAVEHLTFGQNAEKLAAMAADPDWPADVRFNAPHHIPWAFAWTGLIALPLKTVHEFGLWFDESFRGWGVDDLEWGFRVSRSGLPVVLCPEVFALHLPHIRDQSGNQRTESRNYGRFLAKWPRRDVELARVFGDTEANRMWPSYLLELASAGGAHTLGVAVGTSNGRPVARIGVALDMEGHPVSDRYALGFDHGSAEIWPMTGLSLPVPDDYFEQVWVTGAIAEMPSGRKEIVFAEASRVGLDILSEETVDPQRWMD